MSDNINFGALLVQMQEDSDRWFGEGTQNNLGVMALGLCGESGEVADIVKKLMRGSINISDPNVLDHLQEELVDVFHYWMLLSGMLHLDFHKVYEEKRTFNELRFGNGS